MNKFLNGQFYNPTCGNISIEQVIKEIIKYIQEKPEDFYNIIVGCDSSSDQDPCFPVVVVVLRRGLGGRFFLRKIHYNNEERKRFKNWKMRILQEVMLSCELALYLKENLETKITELKNIPNYEFRYIHADIGANGDTKDMIKEVTGLIIGNGFEPKIKPESYAASSVADRYA
ncbi:MAG: hypothetical protein ISS87_01595 [Candidatus Pacebacteria bacterium]|nr:hypothetical protein [Candidatus Paceibacterota bacterium]